MKYSVAGRKCRADWRTRPSLFISHE